MTLALLMEIVGWIGAVLILAGYGLLTAERVTARSVSYQAMNVVGAAGFIANGVWHKAWPSAILNIIWVGIGVVALIRIYAKRDKTAG